MRFLLAVVAALWCGVAEAQIGGQAVVLPGGCGTGSVSGSGAPTMNSAGQLCTSPVIIGGVAGNVPTIGAGGALGDSGYSALLPSPALIRRGINPTVHLAKLEATSTPTVCVIGDSTVSQADYLNPLESQWSKLQSALLAKYPTKTFTFKDFSIGGLSLNHFTIAAPSNWPAWYTNHALTWTSYVASAGCTSLIISFGVNSAGLDTALVWSNVFTSIVSYAAIPDIILSTNIVANPSAIAPYSTASYQAGYVGSAGLQRTIALSGNTLGVSTLPQIGLIDIGRYFNMSVLGRDPVEQIMSAVVPVGTPLTAGTTTSSTFTYSLPQTDGDFNVIFGLTGTGFAASTINVYFADALGGIGVGSASKGFAQFFPNGTTACFTRADFNGSVPTAFVNTVSWVLAGPNTIQVSLQAGRLQMWCNGVKALDQLIPVSETKFQPTLQILAPPAGSVITVNQYSAGKMRAYKPTVAQAACYGSTGGTDSGNGINHVASDCLNAVYAPVIERAFE